MASPNFQSNPCKTANYCIFKFLCKTWLGFNFKKSWKYHNLILCTSGKESNPVTFDFNSKNERPNHSILLFTCLVSLTISYIKFKKICHFWWLYCKKVSCPRSKILLHFAISQANWIKPPQKYLWYSRAQSKVTFVKHK